MKIVDIREVTAPIAGATPLLADDLNWPAEPASADTLNTLEIPSNGRPTEVWFAAGGRR